MPQTKIYGYASFLQNNRQRIGDAIHSCVVEALSYPAEKRFQRFIPLEPEDFIHPPDRTEQYLIIEISLFAGRSIATKKQLIRLLYQKLREVLAITANDIEIILYEIPPHNWGVRGMSGDELPLRAQVKV